MANVNHGGIAFYSSPRRSNVDALLARSSSMPLEQFAQARHLSGETMPLCELDATDIRQRHRSRLGASLVRLMQNLDESHTAQNAAEDQLHQWQDKWSERRDQISRRLELLDMQLENLVQKEQGRPQLALVSAHLHDDEPLALVQ
jgi:hypothetical protein